MELRFLRLDDVGEGSIGAVPPELRALFAPFGVRGLRGLVPPDPELGRLESPPTGFARTWSLRPEWQGAQQRPKKDLVAGGGRTAAAVAISSLAKGEAPSVGWTALDRRFGRGFEVPAFSALGSGAAAAACDACRARETAAASESAEAAEAAEEREPGRMPDNAPEVNAKKPWLPDVKFDGESTPAATPLAPCSKAAGGGLGFHVIWPRLRWHAVQMAS